MCTVHSENAVLSCMRVEISYKIVVKDVHSCIALESLAMLCST